MDVSPNGRGAKPPWTLRPEKVSHHTNLGVIPVRCNFVGEEDNGVPPKDIRVTEGHNGHNKELFLANVNSRSRSL